MRGHANVDRRRVWLLPVIIALMVGVATPVDWRPGDDVIVPPAGSCGVAKDRMDGKEDITCHDWFFCTKKIDKETVMGAIRK